LINVVAKRAAMLKKDEAAAAWATLAEELWKLDDFRNFKTPKFRDVIAVIRKATIVGRNFRARGVNADLSLPNKQHPPGKVALVVGNQNIR
jgi:hypothetical protein